MTSTFKAIAATPSASLTYTVSFTAIKPEQLFSMLNKVHFDALCAYGCPNYQKKWSCPPYSPQYRSFVEGWQYLYILFIQMDTAQFSYIKNNYLKIKAANNILKSRAEKYLRIMASKYGTYISTGSCRLCKPCKCKIGQPCSHPDKMSYSFEALGVDVNALVELCFQSKLLWYQKGHLPKYTSVVCGLLSNTQISFDTLSNEYINIVNK